MKIEFLTISSFFEYFKISIDTITFIFSSGVIAGAVIGSIVFLGVIIGVILCVVKKKGHRGTVIAPAAGGTHITQHSVAFGMSSFSPITHTHIYSLGVFISLIRYVFIYHIPRGANTHLYKPAGGGTYIEQHSVVIDILSL